MSVRLVLAIGMAAAAVVGAASGAAGPADEGGSSGEAWAIRIVTPKGFTTGTAAAGAPSGEPEATSASFVHPGDGTIVSAGATSASVSADEDGTAATAVATSSVEGLVLFGGAVTADLVTVRAGARAGPSLVSGGFDGTSIVNLRVFGERQAGVRIELEDWGVLTTRAEAVERTSTQGVRRYSGAMTALVLELTAAHYGLPSGTEIRIGYAEAAAQPPQREEETEKRPEIPDQLGSGPGVDATNDPEPRPQRSPVPFPLPKALQPPLEAGPYVFPVFGDAAYGNTYGAPRATVEYHHGADIFGEVGQPLVACADGTVFSVGWNDIGGLRLWLRDKQGNEYYYAHLSAFSTLASDGMRVKAGQVVGFMGATGDAKGTQAHLHFEVHPVSLLYFGYDGAVDPTSYLDSWKHVERLPSPLPIAWAPTVPGSNIAPRPGAILLSVSDISSATGLDPASLRRAIESPPARP